MVFQFLRMQGMKLTEQTESITKKVLHESVKYAEEYARKKPVSSQEKLDLARIYALNLLAASGIKVTNINERIEATLQDAFPNRPSHMQALDWSEFDETPTNPDSPRAKARVSK
jgi:hypothetical protein